MNAEIGPILAVDPGERRIGIAISDPTAMLVRPLMIISHVSMTIDGAQIAQIALENHAVLILVGVPTGSEGEELPQTRHAHRLIKAIQNQTEISVTGWDEWGSTQTARQALIEAGVARSKRGGHQDAVAATVILRSYLESNERERDFQNG